MSTDMRSLLAPLKLLTAVLTCVVVLTPRASLSQELGELIDGVGSAYAELYLQPLVDGLGADMNSGLFHTAEVGGGLLPMVDIYVGAKVMGMLVQDADKTMDLSYVTERRFRASDGLRYTVPITFEIVNGPTVFGDTEPGQVTAVVDERVNDGPDGLPGTADDVVIDTSATFDVLPGLIDVPIAPFAVPQVGIGSLFGTDILVRYLPRISDDDFGSIGMRGIGVRHSVSQYLPLFPVDVAAQVMWQELSIQDQSDDDIFTASAFAANVAVSKSLLILTVYAGLQVERSSVSVDYTLFSDDPDLADQSVQFDLTGENRYRLLGGLAFGLGPLVVNADAAVGNRTIVSAGVGLSL